jgi:hypothetical protein
MHPPISIMLASKLTECQIRRSRVVDPSGPRVRFLKIWTREISSIQAVVCSTKIPANRRKIKVFWVPARCHRGLEAQSLLRKVISSTTIKPFLINGPILHHKESKVSNPNMWP